jgi:adenosylmethionine-8-amino-7-oxononanoate aminotransferase
LGAAARRRNQEAFSMSLIQRDRNSIWHPFTQHKTAAIPFAISKGKGSYLFDEQGNRYLDLISSWWVNLHGHAHPEIAEAIYHQAMQLEHVIFSGLTHEPAISLAEQLLSLLPSAFTKVFYSDNGSTAVEVAIKMAYQYWRNVNEPQRKKIIAFENGYHGDTVGSMSLGKKCGFYTHFEDLMFEVEFFPYPDTWLQDAEIDNKEAQVLNALESYLIKQGHETAALIIEPLIQGSGGMRMCRPQFLQKLEKLVRSFGVLIIYDEVMTGFGRTGELFACQKSQTVPDIICLAKGLTGGFLPLAVTVCQEKIYQAFLGDSFAQSLVHGHSYTANPLGCAAALASLKLLQTAEVISQIKMIEQIHAEAAQHILRNNPVKKIRYSGTISAFELAEATEYGSQVSVNLRKKFLERGLLIRPLGDVIYLMPPYCITENELRNAYEVIINEVQGVYA